MVQPWARDYPARPQWQQSERFASEQPLDSGRYHHLPETLETPGGPPMAIEQALRERCRIPARYYFAAAILDSGEPATFAGPNVPKEHVSKFFNVELFQRWIANPDSLADEPDYGVEDSQEDGARHPLSSSRRTSDVLDDEGLRLRKRARRQLSRRTLAIRDDDVPSKISATKKSIQISDDKAVWDIYDQRFRNLQQSACKLIAKAWVKLIEPKKQSNFPYTGDKIPDWWPKPWGNGKAELVRHKEPDHLHKHERLHLLKHIVRMIVEPSTKQHANIQKLNLNVAKLEEATYEALSGFFSDSPANAKKRPYLKEIFYIAKNEEKYKNGAIDGETNVFIMADDKLVDSYASDNEDPGATKVKDEDREHETKSSPSSVSSQRPAAGHGLMVTSTVTEAAAAAVAGPGLAGGAAFISDIPHRGGPPYAAQMMHSDLGADQHAGYVEMQAMCAAPHDAGRRPSMYSAPTDFGAQGGAAAMYPGWPHGTTAPSTSPMYAFTPQQQQQPQPQPPPPAAPFVSPAAAVSMGGPNQPFLHAGFDGLPRTPFDPGHGHMFRPAGMAPAAIHSQGYGMHIPTAHDGRVGVGVPLKPDPGAGRGHGHLQ